MDDSIIVSSLISVYVLHTKIFLNSININVKLWLKIEKYPYFTQSILIIIIFINIDKTILLLLVKKKKRVFFKKTLTKLKINHNRKINIGM